MAKIYRAVIEHPVTGDLHVIGRGTKPRCDGALDAWNAMHPEATSADGTPLIVVEVAE